MKRREMRKIKACLYAEMAVNLMLAQQPRPTNVPALLNKMVLSDATPMATYN